VKFNSQPNSTSNVLDYTRIGMGLVQEMSFYRSPKQPVNRSPRTENHFMSRSSVTYTIG
jgi:hypothetical protein